MFRSTRLPHSNTAQSPTIRSALQTRRVTAAKHVVRGVSIGGDSIIYSPRSLRFSFHNALLGRLGLGDFMNKGFVVAVLLCAALVSCATTNEMVLAPNVVRLDTNASGLIYTSQAGQITMKRAAEATIKRGYTHFRLEQATTSQGSQMVGMSTYGSGFGQASMYGNTAYGSYSGSSFSTPMYAPTAQVGVTVVMFKANEAGAVGAFDAAEVVAKQGKV